MSSVIRVRSGVMSDSFTTGIAASSPSILSQRNAFEAGWNYGVDKEFDLLNFRKAG
jgi:hypothetical protein